MPQGVHCTDSVLGPGSFGLGPSEASPLAVADDRTWLVADGPGGPALSFGAGTARAFTALGAARFGDGIVPDDPQAADLRVAGGDDEVAITWISQVGLSESGAYGAPRLAYGRSDGALSLPIGPSPRYPKRNLGASAARIGTDDWLLVWQQKPGPSPFRRSSPVHGAVIAGLGRGPTRTLVTDPVQSAVAHGLHGGRVLLTFDRGRRPGVVVVSPDGTPHAARAPSWPALARNHDPAPTRGVTAGPWALLTRADTAGLRIATRRFVAQSRVPVAGSVALPGASRMG